MDGFLREVWNGAKGFFDDTESSAVGAENEGGFISVDVFREECGQFNEELGAFVEFGR